MHNLFNKIPAFLMGAGAPPFFFSEILHKCQKTFKTSLNMISCIFTVWNRYLSSFDANKNFKHWLNIIGIGQRIVTHVPVGFCTKFGYFHPELRIFMNFSWGHCYASFCKLFQCLSQNNSEIWGWPPYKRSIDSGSGFPNFFSNWLQILTCPLSALS